MEANEKLAAHICKLWMEHVRFILSNCELNEDGTMTISKTFAICLAEISRTPYDEISEAEKECIRMVANNIQELLLEEKGACEMV